MTSLPPLPPPYLKVWICHWILLLLLSGEGTGKPLLNPHGKRDINLISPSQCFSAILLMLILMQFYRLTVPSSTRCLASECSGLNSIRWSLLPYYQDHRDKPCSSIWYCYAIQSHILRWWPNIVNGKRGQPNVWQPFPLLGCAEGTLCWMPLVKMNLWLGCF